MLLKQKISIAVIAIAFLFSSGVFLTQEMMFGRSSYSYLLNILDCNNLEPLKGCRHEIGHKMDDDLGWPSLSEEFSIAMKAHVLVETRPLEVPDDVAIPIVLYPDRDPREIYAGIYASVEGDISRLPIPLQAFYSTDPVYLTLYNCLAANEGLNICGSSFSYLSSQK